MLISSGVTLGSISYCNFAREKIVRQVGAVYMIPERLSFGNEFRSRMKFVLHSQSGSALGLSRVVFAQDKIRMRHWSQTTRDCDFQPGTIPFLVYIVMIPEWHLVPEREFHFEWKPEWLLWELNVVSVSCKQMQRKIWRWCGKREKNESSSLLLFSLPSPSVFTGYDITFLWQGVTLVSCPWYLGGKESF